MINELSPKTKYYFDIASWDEANNQIYDNHAGSHYSFTTLEGLVSVPYYGYNGYVISSNPTSNSFTSMRMCSGSTQNVYIAAAQFEIPSIPLGAKVLGASVILYGTDWDTKGAGTWKLKLLNSSIDNGWSLHGYTQINGASIDNTILPALDSSQIGPRIWNVFTFTRNQINNLEYHIKDGKVSFKIDGPSSGSLFYWASGYYPGSSGDSFRPCLSIRYSTSTDNIGPSAAILIAVPNPTNGSNSITLNASISDVSTGGSDITSAEWYQNPDPGLGNGSLLYAIDGSFDTPTEEVTALINISTWSIGEHIIFVRGLDASGYWGISTNVKIYKTSGSVYEVNPVLLLIIFVIILTQIVTKTRKNHM